MRISQHAESSVGCVGSGRVGEVPLLSSFVLLGAECRLCRWYPRR